MVLSRWYLGWEGIPFPRISEFGVKPARLTAGRQERNTSPAKKVFCAWLKYLHDLDLLCLPDLINPWGLHFFAVIIRLGNLPNTEAAY